MEIEEKYKYDVYIMSVYFDFYNGDDPVDIPCIVFSCKVFTYDESTDEGFIEYFKLKFIMPSRYNIQMISNNGDKLMSESELLGCKLYDCNYPFTFDMKKLETSPKHSRWEILFTGVPVPDKKYSYINIYADDLVFTLDKKVRYDWTKSD